MTRLGIVACGAAVGWLLVTGFALEGSALSCSEFLTEAWLTGVDPEGEPLITVHVVNAAAGQGGCIAWAPHAVGAGWLVWQDNDPRSYDEHGLAPVVYAEEIGSGDRRILDIPGGGMDVWWKETAIRGASWYFTTGQADNDAWTLYAHALASDETVALRTWNDTKIVVLSDDAIYLQQDESRSPTVSSCPLDGPHLCQTLVTGVEGAPDATLRLQAASHDWLFFEAPDEPSDHLEQWQYWLFHREAAVWQKVTMAPEPDAENGSYANGYRLAHAEIIGDTMTHSLRTELSVGGARTLHGSRHHDRPEHRSQRLGRVWHDVRDRFRGHRVGVTGGPTRPQTDAANGSTRRGGR